MVRVRLGGDASETRIVVNLKRAASAGSTPTGARLGVTLKGVGAGGGLEGADGLVRAWSVTSAATAPASTGADARRQRRAAIPPPADGVASYRYVIDIAAAPGKGGAPARLAAVAAAMAADAAPAPAPHLRKIIVIDAGAAARRGWRANPARTSPSAAALALKARLERTAATR